MEIFEESEILTDMLDAPLGVDCFIHLLNDFKLQYEKLLIVGLNEPLLRSIIVEVESRFLCLVLSLHCLLSLLLGIANLIIYLTLSLAIFITCFFIWAHLHPLYFFLNWMELWLCLKCCLLHEPSFNLNLLYPSIIFNQSTKVNELIMKYLTG